MKMLGQQESTFLAYVQMRNLRTVRSGDLVEPLNLSAKQEKDLLSRMNRRGLIAQVRRGLYLVPRKLPLGGVWTPDGAAVINALMADKQACYQITGLGAFNRYGFDEQIPSRLSIYNEAISGERSIGRIALTLIKVAPDRLGDTEQVTTPSGETMVYSSRVRTLVDAVFDWSRFDTLPRAYDWIRADLNAGRIHPDDLAQSILRYGNLGTIRRIGAVLEKAGMGERVLKRLAGALTPVASKIPLVPGRSVRGAFLKRWGIVDNG